MAEQGQQAAAAAQQSGAEIVGLHHRRHQPVHADGNGDAHGAKSKDFNSGRCFLQAAQRNDDDFGGQDKVGADGAADFAFLVAGDVVGYGVRRFVVAVEQAVQQFFRALKAQISAAGH